MYLVDGSCFGLGSDQQAGAGIEYGFAAVNARHLGINSDGDSKLRNMFSKSK
jgi:hypothetical protein